MELLKSSIFADCSTHRYAPIDPDCESRSSPIASRRPAFVINCTGLVLGAGLPGGAGGTAARILLIFDPTNKNAALADRAPVCSGRRPTDLCATALFSFQGTDAFARPISDRITDRTKGARRQSQQRIGYHRTSTVSTSTRRVSSTSLSTAAHRPSVKPVGYELAGRALPAAPNARSRAKASERLLLFVRAVH
jgi:hypothetical protein